MSAPNVVPQPYHREIPRASADTAVAITEIDEPRAKSVEVSPTLRDQIAEIMKENQIGLYKTEGYVPDEKLEALFTTDTVRSALGESPDHMLVEFILQKARKTFATVLLISINCKHREEVMKGFQSTNFTDETLLSTALEFCDKQPCKRDGEACPHHFPLHGIWDDLLLKDFKSKRWHFLVLTFDHDIFQYEIDENQFLPFTKNVSRNEESSGNFSEVKCVNMLTSKQTKIVSSDKTIVVALKTLKRISEPGYDIKKEWRREAKAHKELNGMSDHIIKAIAAFRQIAADKDNDKFHLLFEWADGGNLYSFWNKNQEPQVNDDIELSRKRVMEALKQLVGLAHALKVMHNTTPAKSVGRRRSSPTQFSHIGSPEQGAPGRSADLELPLPEDEWVSPFSLQGRDVSQEGEGGAPSLIISPPRPSELNTHEFRGLVPSNTSINSENWRHGDIKPENILRFTRDEEDAWIGTLKLADLGRAKQHLLTTKYRMTKEKEHWRTRWYEPPDLAEEIHDRAEGKISRLFDIWSMGCVIFETVLWLLYGFVINDFMKESNFTLDEQFATPYWRNVGGRYEVSEAASRWMSHILQHDPERHCAIGHLIELVTNRLLKVNLPTDSDSYQEGCRTNAKDLEEQLRRIIDKAKKDEKYLFSGASRKSITSPRLAEPSKRRVSQSRFGSSLSPKDAEHRDSPVDRGPATTIAQQRVYTSTIENRWEISTDDDIMKMRRGTRQWPSSNPDLCEACKEINILSLEISFALDTLQSNAKANACDLCELVSEVVNDMEIGGSEKITFTRSADCFVLPGTEKKVLRLYRKDTTANQDIDNILVGEPVSSMHIDVIIELLKAWLQECDTNHKNICASRHGNQQLPKRLIDVENPRKPKIRESDGLPSTINYIAFSHKWGNQRNGAMTTKQNLEQRKKRIPLDDLPPNFKNVIDITCALSCKYLWIDTLCIVQGPDGDFAEQADTMQTTFSGAYCVIADCNAETKNGFLQKTDVQMSVSNNKEVFVSAVTNDFERDVLQSPLSRRGWVLQEHALARRTIFITNNQMYWECGDGVRCATSVKLRNNEAAFLGDPNFPGYTIRANSTRGEQIHLFTKLFERYSTLELSYPQDRPIAIDGLMDRLTNAFKTESLAGLFKSFWGRCLLWQRAEGVQSLKRIPPGVHTKKTPPSWSWMAVGGAISFLEPKGGVVNWNEKGVNLPFANRTQSSWLKTSHLGETNAIRAEAFDFTIDENLTNSEIYLSYDGGQKLPNIATKYVIIGSEKQRAEDPDSKKHYILLVAGRSQANGAISYERVGVGHLAGKFIKFMNPVSILIE